MWYLTKDYKQQIWIYLLLYCFWYLFFDFKLNSGLNFLTSQSLLICVHCYATFACFCVFSKDGGLAGLICWAYSLDYTRKHVNSSKTSSSKRKQIRHETLNIQPFCFLLPLLYSKYAGSSQPKEIRWRAWEEGNIYLFGDILSVTYVFLAW